MTAQTLDGVYNLRGIHDMAAGFQFTPDGRFEFFYIYGASDRHATGTYAMDGDTVKLKSDKQPGKDFKIESQDKKGKGFTRKLEEKISLQVTEGCGRLGFSFSYGTLAC